MANLYDPQFDEPRQAVDGLHARRARLGHQLGTERIGLSLWVLPSGQAAYPYHFHLAEEEVFAVLEGTPLLRDAKGGGASRAAKAFFCLTDAVDYDEGVAAPEVPHVDPA